MCLYYSKKPASDGVTSGSGCAWARRAATSVLGPLLVGGGISLPAFSQTDPSSEPRGSLAGERAAQELRRALTNEVYHLQYGPVRFQTEAHVGAAYTDNVFLSGVNPRDDFIINPEVNLAALLPVGQLNMLRLSLGLSYEWFAKNHSLNSDVPLVSPDSELVFNIFVGDFRIRLHDKFSYQQTLVFNEQAADQVHVFNFTDVGRFDRLNNFVGPSVDWDLNKVIVSTTYDHENFISETDRFKYLDRASEWFTLTLNYLLGDRTKAGVEGLASLHDYDHETILNDNWRMRAGPFAEARLPKAVTLRAGGGYDGARFDSAAASGNAYDNWYCYARARQELLWFNHSLAAGHETGLGDNANNLRTSYVRYSISSDAIKDLELEAHLSANFSKEFGGEFHEDFIHYIAGFRVGYQFHKYLAAEFGYELFWKDSDSSDRSFHRDRVNLDVTFRF
jgi:hypothetical protein